ITAGSNVPTPIARFPAQIIQATAGVSGDRQTIVIQAASAPDAAGTGPGFVVIRYSVADQTASARYFSSPPPPRPKSVSVDQTGANILSDWGLLQYLPDGPLRPFLLAQFPRPDGAFNIGSHAWDLTLPNRLFNENRTLIYAQIPTADDNAVLHVV